MSFRRPCLDVYFRMRPFLLLLPMNPQPTTPITYLHRAHMQRRARCRLPAACPGNIPFTGCAAHLRCRAAGVGASSLVAMQAQVFRAQQQAALVREGKLDPEEIRARWGGQGSPPARGPGCCGGSRGASRAEHRLLMPHLVFGPASADRVLHVHYCAHPNANAVGARAAWLPCSTAKTPGCRSATRATGRTSRRGPPSRTDLPCPVRGHAVAA